MRQQIKPLLTRSVGIPLLAGMLVVVLLLLAAIGGSRADQPVEPSEIFPVLESQAADEDILPVNAPDEARKAIENFGIGEIRLLGRTDLSHYFIAEDARGYLCLIRVLDGDAYGLHFNTSCADPGYVAENGLIVIGQARGGPVHVGYALPEGYEQVVDENRGMIGEVHNQLYAAEIKVGQLPRTIVATGPAGELTRSINGPER